MSDSHFNDLSTKQLRALKRKADKVAQKTVKKPTKKELVKHMTEKYDLEDTGEGFNLRRREVKVSSNLSQEDMVAAIYKKLTNS